MGSLMKIKGWLPFVTHCSRALCITNEIVRLMHLGQVDLDKRIIWSRKNPWPRLKEFSALECCLESKVYYVVFIRFFFPCSIPLFMNVRFDTWMKRANLCVREPTARLSLLAEISSYSGPYGPHLLPRRIDGNHESCCCCCSLHKRKVYRAPTFMLWRVSEHYSCCCSILGPFSHSKTLAICL